MSWDTRIGIAGLIVAFFAIGSFYICPNKRWIGWSSLGISVLLLVSWAALEVNYYWQSKNQRAANNDPVSHIEGLLSNVRDPNYRQLVAAVIYAFDPNASLSVGTLESTPDGTRTVDMEIRSIHEGTPTLTAIDIIDLPSGRKADITAVDAAASKRSDIKADVMLLCSNTGFEEDAIRKAKRTRIGLISILHQGDKRIKAIIEEEIYLRKINIPMVNVTWNGENLQNLNPDPTSLEYNGGSVVAWLEIEAGLIASMNPELDFGVTAIFNFKEPTHFYRNGKTVTLKSIGISFTPSVQWLAKTVQIDATTGIYDYVRGRVRLTGGDNSYTVRGIDFDHAKPLLSPPPIGDLGTGLRPGEFDMSLVDVKGAVPQEGTVIAKLDDLVRPEDLMLKIPKEKLEQLKHSSR